MFDDVAIGAAPPPPGGIVNGGFESGNLTGWTTALAASVVSGGHSGSYAARVGSPAAGYFVAYLTHVVGAKKAKEIWMLCRRYTAQDALEMGLVNAVVPHEKLDDEVDRWCEELLAKSPSCLKILKASFRTLYQPLREASRRDWVAEIAPEFYRSGEADEGKNAFLERREPDFARYPR